MGVLSILFLFLSHLILVSTQSCDLSSIPSLKPTETEEKSFNDVRDSGMWRYNSLFWPMPVLINKNNEISKRYLPVKQLHFHLDQPSGSDTFACSVMKDALTRFMTERLSPKCQGNSVYGLDVHIHIHILSNIQATPADLYTIDESYVIHVKNETRVKISAATFVGALHSLQTLSQMFLAGPTCHLAPLVIQDGPRFQHRGILLDTARNYFPLDDIKRLLNGMSATKMNVLHWHVYDSQSFPIAWEYEDGKLYKAAAYKTATRNNTAGNLKIYSRNDVDELIQFAFYRGIRIIPEFDMPGHTRSFYEAYPDIMSCVDYSPYDGQPAWIARRCNQPPCGQFNPNNEQTYTIVDAFLKSMSEWFPDPDEVNPMCWDLESNDLPLVRPLMQKFAGRVFAMQQANNKKTMAWDEVVIAYGLSNVAEFGGNNTLPQDAIIQAWEPVGSDIDPSLLGVSALNPFTATIEVSTRMGYQVVVSPYNRWFLDCSPQAPWCSVDSRNNSWHNWTQMYDYEPTTGIKHTHMVIGGETNAWSETIKRDNFDYIVWPRAAAVAERLWSKQSVSRGNSDAENRLERFRVSLINEFGMKPSILSEGVGKWFKVYRPEWCDFNLNTPAQNSSSKNNAGWISNSTGPFYNYCEPASTYDTESVVRSAVNRVDYPY